jgi:hypothetical protein
MRYVKKYESFKQEDSTNEEFLGALYNAAKGALKNFLGNISAPFKTLKDDFKKGMEKEQVKKTMITKMDALLKGATDGINKAEDEEALTNMRLDFGKQIDDQIAEFDKEVKIVKESNSINEGKIQDALIGARVAFGMVKKKAAEIKADFDKKYAAAVDLAAKKAVAISEIKTIIDDFKKTIMNNEIFKKAEEEYRAANQIPAAPATDYKVGDELIYLRKGQQKTAWDALTDEQKKASATDKAAKKIVNVKKVDKIEGDKFTFTGKDGKQIIKTTADIIGKSETGTEGTEDGVDQTKLTADLKALNDETDKTQIKRVVKFLDFIKTKADKLPEVDKLLGGEEAAAPATEE